MGRMTGGSGMIRGRCCMLLQEEYEDIVHALGDKGASHGFRGWKRVSAANVA